MKTIGKIGKRNIEANKILKWIYNDYGITNCELRFKDCLFNNFLTFAHRHKRDWYKSKENIKLLSDFNQTILACQSCHRKIEDNKKLSEEMFEKLRNKKCSYEKCEDDSIVWDASID